MPLLTTFLVKAVTTPSRGAVATTRFAVKTAWTIYVAAPAVLAALGWQWEHTTAEVPWLGLVAAAVYLLGGAAAFHYVHRMRTASRLRADAELRWLVTVTDRDAPEGAAPRLEMLPVSRLAWTEHARPAPWRLDA